MLLLVVLGLVPLVYGYPAGPPTTACTDMAPVHGASVQTSSPPYTITLNSTSYTRTGGVTVTVTATNAGTPFRGFFLQARQSGDTSAVGTFSLGTETGVKLIGCSGTDNAVSHTDRTDKTTKTVTWMYSDGGDVTFQATIVNVQTNYWMGVQSALLEFSSATTTNTNTSIILLIIMALTASLV